MLDRHLIAEIRPQAKKENVVFWKDYRVTVLQDRLFRVEKMRKKYFVIKLHSRCFTAICQSKNLTCRKTKRSV